MTRGSDHPFMKREPAQQTSPTHQRLESTARFAPLRRLIYAYNIVSLHSYAEQFPRKARLYNITFYSDSQVFGGNEQMAIRAHEAIRRHNDLITITWIVNITNQRLIGALQYAGIEYFALDLEPTFKIFRNPISLLRKTLRIAKVLRSSRAHLVMLVQGWIADGYDGVFAARLAGVPFCSYIPLAHSPTELAVRRWPAIRTAILSCFFLLISRYITIDEQQAIRLRRWNRRAQITVVENYIPRPSPPSRKGPEGRQLFGIPLQSKVLAVIGRISFRQKCQDWLVDALKDDPFLSDKTLLFVGDGPDAPSLAQKIKSSPWRDHMHLLGWHNDLEELYSMLDLLMIPSMAEGVPLVMIEALARHIPVVGSDRDGMKSWLPAEWRFPFRNAAAMKQAITSALSEPPVGYWKWAEERLASATDERRFGTQFADALLACCQPAPRGSDSL